jgi:hypothetical protein
MYQTWSIMHLLIGEYAGSFAMVKENPTFSTSRIPKSMSEFVRGLADAKWRGGFNLITWRKQQTDLDFSGRAKSAAVASACGEVASPAGAEGSRSSAWAGVEEEEEEETIWQAGAPSWNGSGDLVCFGEAEATEAEPERPRPETKLWLDRGGPAPAVVMVVPC